MRNPTRQGDPCREQTDGTWVRVLVADSDPNLERPIDLFLERQARGYVVGGARTKEEAVRLARLTQPDVIVTAISGLQPFEWIPEIVRELPATRVLVWTAYPDRELAEESFKAGAPWISEQARKIRDGRGCDLRRRRGREGAAVCAMRNNLTLYD